MAMFVACLTLATIVTASSSDVVVPVEKVSATIKAEDAKAGIVHEKWLSERLKEARSIKPGMTYGDLAKSFQGDGGLSFGKVRRFVMTKCTLIKVDVEFERGDTEESHLPGPERDKLRIKSVSKPYLEEAYAD